MSFKRLDNVGRLSLKNVAVALLSCFSFYSTFDEYVAEVKSGRLEWSPVHKSDKFWVSYFHPNPVSNILASDVKSVQSTCRVP